MKRLITVSILVLAFYCIPSYAATITAVSCSQSDVQNAINLAVTGDTVIVPAGMCSWDVKVTVNKGITLQGAGIGQTIILDAVLQNAVFVWDCERGKAQRLTGFEFRNGGRIANETDGIIVTNCTNLDNTTMRLDHNQFDHMTGVMYRPNTTVGSYDHNRCLFRGANRCVYLYDAEWNDQGSFGDASWAAPLKWGSGEFMFFEDNEFINDADTNQNGAFDGFRGTREVIRFNKFVCSIVVVHGTESSGRNHGGRAVEIYANIFDNTSCETPVSYFGNIRSGSALLWGNKGINIKGGQIGSLSLTQDRAAHAFIPYGGADGTALSCGNKLPCWDITEGPLAMCGAGTICHVTSHDPKARTVTVSDMLVPNALVGLTIRRASQCAQGEPVADWTPSETNCFSVVIENTDHIVEFASNVFATDTPLTFNSGDTFQVYRILQALDCVGCGTASYMSGGNQNTAPTMPDEWNDQILEPLLMWLNTNDGAPLVEPGPGAYRGQIRERTHWFDDSDIGSGITLPATCTENVSWFWDTDAGNWNDGSNAAYTGQGTLSKCTSANMWTTYYTPFTYPHPLVTGVPEPPIPTNGAVIVALVILFGLAAIIGFAVIQLYRNQPPAKP